MTEVVTLSLITNRCMPFKLFSIILYLGWQKKIENSFILPVINMMINSSFKNIYIIIYSVLFKFYLFKYRLSIFRLFVVVYFLCSLNYVFFIRYFFFFLLMYIWPKKYCFYNFIHLVIRISFESILYIIGLLSVSIFASFEYQHFSICIFWPFSFY